MPAGRPRKPEVTKVINRAIELIGEGEQVGAALAAANKEFGQSVSASTLYARRKANGPGPQADPDALNETPTDGAEIPVFVRDYSDQPKHSIYPIGDLHKGAAEHAADRLTEWLEYIEGAEYTSVLNTGDNLNCAIPGSVSDTHTEKLTVEDGRKELTETFRPLAEADKLDVLADGNHEWRVWRATGDSPNSAVADALGVNYARSVCVIRYLVGNQTYEVFFRHGTGGGKRLGASVNNLQDQEQVIDADIYVSGHTHTQVAFPKDIFVKGEDGEYIRKKRLFVCSASFLAYEAYAANAGYAPTHIGAPRIFLDGTRFDMHASV